MHHLTYMKPLLTLALYLALAPVSFAAAAPLSYSGLDAGYRQMYNLQFEQAHLTFARWEQDHPADPLGPASDAAAYLFAEFDRLGVLESEFFTDDDGFKKRRNKSPIQRPGKPFGRRSREASAWPIAILAAIRVTPTRSLPRCWGWGSNPTTWP